MNLSKIYLKDLVQIYFFGLKETAALFKKDKNFFKLNSHLKLNEGSSLDKSQKIWRRANGVILGGNSLLSKIQIYFYQTNGLHIFQKQKDVQFGT